MEISSFNRKISSHKRNSSPVYIESNPSSLARFEEIKVTESVSATHRLSQDFMIQSVFPHDETMGLLESTEPYFHFIMNKVSMLLGDQESDFE